MSEERNTQYQFVDTDTDTLVASMVSVYENLVGSTVQPASPEKLFIQWAASLMIQIYTTANYIGNQNLPSRAVGENLDALGELFNVGSRPEAQAATTTVRFTISAAQTTAVLVPMGTRVTDKSGGLVWETTADAYVAVGNTTVDVAVVCQTAGTICNGYTAGQIATAVDLFDYYASVTNLTTSDGGADEATDDEYYALMKAGQDAYSTAGAVGAYVYHASNVSTEIADVVANNPDDGEVAIYVLMDDGTMAGTEIKAAVLAACSGDYVRPLTDSVSVKDPTASTYNITFTYYIPSDSTTSATDIATAVNDAVTEYVAWQSGKLGRDINPSMLIGLLMQTGIKRVNLTAPVFTVLSDGSDDTAPAIAQVGTVTVTSGGYEDE